MYRIMYRDKQGRETLSAGAYPWAIADALARKHNDDIRTRTTARKVPAEA